MSQHDLVALGSRRELFVDDALIDHFTGSAALRLHPPVPREVSLVTDRPWEGNMCGGYKTVFRDGPIVRMYYQAWHGVITGQPDGSATMAEAPICIGYVESPDGIAWTRPSLGLHAFEGSTDNNITFTGLGEDNRGVHGFAPFKDANPACSPEARYKALGGNERAWPMRLYALRSPDGLRWSMVREEPLAVAGAFDSQNLAFWDTARGEYRMYLRDFEPPFFRGIKTCTSPDFLHWSEPQWLDFPGVPKEQLYTNQVTPYYRAPHLFIGFPARYVERPWSPAIEALPELEHRRLRARVSERYGSAVTDTLFMSSRDGQTFRRWGEAFIRPGLRTEGSWCYGDTYTGWGMVETPSDVVGAPHELSIYAAEGYWRGTANRFRRYTLRVDGFVSVQATRDGGALTTHPLTFTGSRLSLNLSASAAGSARVALLRPDGTPYDGYALEDCIEILGDTLDYTVRWTAGTDVSRLAGLPIRLHIALIDADVFSFLFGE